MIDDLRFYDLDAGLDERDECPTAGLLKVHDDMTSMLSFEICNLV